MKDMFCVLDTETTGLDPDRHEVIQVAAIMCSTDLTVIDEYEFKLKPEHIERASAKALEINGYSPKTWKYDFRNHRTAWVNLNKWMRSIAPKPAKIHMVGQNIKFDYRFLRGEYKRHKVPFVFTHDMIDVIDVAKLWCKEAGITMSSYRLSKLEKLTGYKNYNPHDALADVRVTLEILNWFLRELTRRGKNVAAIAQV